MSKLFVNEIFFSLQGEGLFTGCPAIFIRLQGCHVGCPFCDTRYAIGRSPQARLPDNSEEVLSNTKEQTRYALLDVPWILNALTKKTGSYKPLAILTGGEPFEQDIQELVKSLLSAGYPVHIETSGTQNIPCDQDAWITLSPKKAGVLPENWKKADEIKLPIATADDLDRYLDIIREVNPGRVLLQPIDADPVATALCTKLCLQYNFRLSLQIHKVLGIR